MSKAISPVLPDNYFQPIQDPPVLIDQQVIDLHNLVQSVMTKNPMGLSFFEAKKLEDLEWDIKISAPVEVQEKVAETICESGYLDAYSHITGQYFIIKVNKHPKNGLSNTFYSKENVQKLFNQAYKDRFIREMEELQNKVVKLLKDFPEGNFPENRCWRLTTYEMIPVQKKMVARICESKNLDAYLWPCGIAIVRKNAT